MLIRNISHMQVLINLVCECCFIVWHWLSQVEACCLTAQDRRPRRCWLNEGNDLLPGGAGPLSQPCVAHSFLNKTYNDINYWLLAGSWQTFHMFVGAVGWLILHGSGVILDDVFIIKLSMNCFYFVFLNDMSCYFEAHLSRIYTRCHH